MSGSDAGIPDSEVSWAMDFESLATELKVSFSVVYQRCAPGSLHAWSAVLTFLKRQAKGFGNSQAEAKDAAARNAFPWLRLATEETVKKKSRSSQFGAVRRELGQKNEFAVLDALSNSSIRRPAWFKSVRKATPEEDARGIDLVIETHDLGRLFLQVKSSRAFARRFEEKRRPSMIGLIIVSSNDDSYLLNDRAMEQLLQLRQRILERRHRSCA